jgi:hypothetical protein
MQAGPSDPESAVFPLLGRITPDYEPHRDAIGESWMDFSGWAIFSGSSLLAKTHRSPSAVTLPNADTL